jgi:hypothetical protein
MKRYRLTRRIAGGLSAFALGLVALLLAAGGAALAAGEAVDWWVFSGGGAPSSGGNVTLNTTLGQPVAGPSAGGDFALGAGYWYGNAALAASGPAIEWWVFSNAGTLASGGNVTLNDTLGQSFTGPSAFGDVALGAGYWTATGSGPTALTLPAFAARPAPVGWGIGVLGLLGLAAVGWWAFKRFFCAFKVGDDKPLRRLG